MPSVSGNPGGPMGWFSRIREFDFVAKANPVGSPSQEMIRGDPSCFHVTGRRRTRRRSMACMHNEQKSSTLSDVVCARQTAL